MGRGRSKAGAKSGNKKTSNVAPTQEEMNAMKRRQQKANVGDLNDDYTFAMLQASNGYHTDGEEFSDEESLISSVVGGGYLTDSTNLASDVTGLSSYYNIAPKNVKTALDSAVKSFSDKEKASTGGTKQYYADMVNFTKLIKRNFQ